MPSAKSAREIVVQLACGPRFAGSDAEATARKSCAAWLTAAGFDVSEEAFGFSEFPARLGPPLGALLVSAVVLLAGHLVSDHSAALPGLGVLLVGLATIRATAGWLTRTGVLRLPWLRSRSVNLLATRGGASRDRPSVWLVAHLDTKSQTIPMLVRVASSIASAGMIATMLAAMVAAVVLDLTSEPDEVSRLATTMREFAGWLSIAVVLSTFPMVLCFTGNRSPGAIDNASGVAAVLLATVLIGPRSGFGVIITSGEEFALAGSRALAANHGEPSVAVNCDTIDDDGAFICMASGGRPARIWRAMAEASARERIPVSFRGMIPGILADNIAFTDAGWESATLSRGNLATLGRVHTSGDRPDRIDGAGIVNAARLLAVTVKELT